MKHALAELFVQAGRRGLHEEGVAHVEIAVARTGGLAADD